MSRATAPRAAFAALAALTCCAGCQQNKAAAPLTKAETDMMRQPAGSVPMPPEAAKAMQNAGRGAPGGAPPPAGTKAP